MKKIINGKTYNTETAIKLFENGTGYTANFDDWYEEYYITKKGAYFMKYWGGAKSKYAKYFNNNRNTSEGTGLIVLIRNDVIRALSNNSYNLNENAINTYLDIQEA